MWFSYLLESLIAPTIQHLILSIYCLLTDLNQRPVEYLEESNNWCGPQLWILQYKVTQFDYLSTQYLITYQIIFHWFLLFLPKKSYTASWYVWGHWVLAVNHLNHQNLKKSLLSYKCGLIFVGMKEKKILEKMKFKMANSKKRSFFKIANSQYFLWKFHGAVLGFRVEFIDAKGIGMAQPIWPWGCPT